MFTYKVQKGLKESTLLYLTTSNFIILFGGKHVGLAVVYRSAFQLSGQPGRHPANQGTRRKRHDYYMQ